MGFVSSAIDILNMNGPHKIEQFYKLFQRPEELGILKRDDVDNFDKIKIAEEVKKAKDIGWKK